MAAGAEVGMEDADIRVTDVQTLGMPSSTNVSFPVVGKYNYKHESKLKIEGLISLYCSYLSYLSHLSQC